MLSDAEPSSSARDGDLPPYDHDAATRILDAMNDPDWEAKRPILNRQIALDTAQMPCPKCRRGECEQPSGRYIVTATYEAVVIAHSHEEALAIAGDAKYDHRVENMRIIHPDTADVRWPDA